MTPSHLLFLFLFIYFLQYWTLEKKRHSEEVFVK